MNSKTQLTRRTLLQAERSLPGPAPGPRSDAPRAEGAGTGPRRPRLAVALVYPCDYAIGMSSLGYQLVYRAIGSHPFAVCERFFTDTLGEGSLESGAPLSAFDVIIISASFEMDDPAIIGVIEAAGLPRLAADRGDRMGRRAGRGAPPLVVMGGVLVSVNRLPLMPFIDVFAHGDGEMLIAPLLDALCGGVSSGAPSAAPAASDPRARLEALAPLPGFELTPGARLAAGMPVDDAELDAARVMTPAELAAELVAHSAPHSASRFPAPARVSLDDLAGTPCVSQIISPHMEFADMVLVDLARGCPHHCTFCWIGHHSPPYRQRPPDDIIRAVEPWTALTNRFGLVSSAVGAHAEIDEVCRWFMARDLKVSYSSLRVEEVTSTMLEALARGGQKSITIAPEAGSPRVRKLLGKRITDDEILEVTERAMSLGVENLKMYFMVGIPSETEDETMDIARFGERVRKILLAWGSRRGRVGTLGFNVGVFVPKPGLPLNHIEPTPLPIIKKRLGALTRALAKMPNTRVNVSSPDLAAAQSILSMGGVEAAGYAALAHDNGGDWRAANRAWRDQAERQFVWRGTLSRTGAETLRARSSLARTP